MIARLWLFALCGAFMCGAQVSFAQSASEIALQELLNHRRTCFSPNEIEILRQDLSTLLERGNTRAVQLLEFESELSAQHQRIKKEQARLEALIDEFNQKMAYTDNAALEDIKSLAGVYEAMEPRVAAQALTSMPPSFSAGLVRHMDEQKAARILRYMAPSDVSQLSVTLAARNTQIKGDF